MHKIDSLYATVDNKYTQGNPTLGVKPTQLSADHLNAFQEELVNVIEAAGITLVKGTNTQLLAAIQILAGLSGGGGGSGARWMPAPGNSPIPAEDTYGSVFLFEAGKNAKLNLAFKVPQSYTQGNQITLKVGHYSPSATNTQLLKANAYLVKANTDAVTSQTKNRTTTNTAITNTLANKYTLTTLDITDANGQINGNDVLPGDMIFVELFRATDTDTADIAVFPTVAEPNFG